MSQALTAAGTDAYKAAPLGLLVLILLGLASYALFRSMSKHLRKVGSEFPGQSTGPRPGAPDFPVSPGYSIDAIYGSASDESPQASVDLDGKPTTRGD